MHVWVKGRRKAIGGEKSDSNSSLEEDEILRFFYFFLTHSPAGRSAGSQSPIVKIGGIKHRQK